MIKYIYKPLALVLLLAGIASAQSAEGILENLQNKFKSINSFTADFTQTTTSPSIGNYTISGKIFYKKGNKFRVELDGQTIVSNGDVIWNYNKAQDRVVISLPGDENQVFDFEDLIIDMPAKDNVRILEGGSGISITPPKNTGFKNAEITVSKNSFVDKLKITDFSGSVFTINLKNVKTNAGLEDSLFKFNPDEGTEIIDFR